MLPGPQRGEAPGGTRSLAFFDRILKCAVVLLIGSHFAAPACTVEVGDHKINFLSNHCSADCFEDVLSDAAFFFCHCVVAMQGHHREARFPVPGNAQAAGLGHDSFERPLQHALSEGT